MRVATGVDIIDLSQISETLQDPSRLQRMLSPGDISKSTPEHLAGRIAIKEAVIKALDMPGGSWLDIRIHDSGKGKPVISLVNPPPNLVSIDGSISHHGGLVVGFAVALLADDEDG